MEGGRRGGGEDGLYHPRYRLPRGGGNDRIPDSMMEYACGKRGAPMGEEKCPFLEMTTVTFCKAYPVKKMIPLDRSTSAKGLCHTGNYRLCSAFRELEAPGSTAERVRGFLLRPDYYFHPRHLWVSPGKENQTEVRVGADDFSQRLFWGGVSSFPPPGGGAGGGESGRFLAPLGRRG